MDTSTSTQNETDSLVASFHRVLSLIPDEQQLKAIPPEMRVSDALKLMQDTHYSQLPVVAGNAVLGVFSYRSFSAKVIAKQKSSKESIGELPVEDFLEDFEYVYPFEDWNRVLRYLNQDDAFFVGNRSDLDGLVTTMDMLGYFQKIANPFIMIAEIELSLRQIIHASIDDALLDEAIERSLRTAYPEGEIPTELKRMTFDNYVQIISNGENWPYFESMFGTHPRTKKQTIHKLKQLGEWRNIIFHFRRRLQGWELTILAEHREWLHRRVQAFEGRQRVAEEEQATATKDKPDKLDRRMVLEKSDAAAGEFFTWMLDVAVAGGLTIYWGTTGFSVRKRLPHGMASLAYGYPAGRFEIFFGHLNLSEQEEHLWRQKLLSFGVLTAAGEKTLRGPVNQKSVDKLREVYLALLEMVESFTRFPLPIQATVHGETIKAELLDENGQVLLDETIYKSPSGAGKAASGWTAVNGWRFWTYFDQSAGEWKSIDALRK